MGFTKGETKVKLLEDCNMAAPCQIEDSAIYIHGYMHYYLIMIDRLNT